MNRPQYFISAVSDEFRTLRGRVAALLGARGIDALPMEQLPTGYGPLAQRLRASVEQCDALIQIVGRRYGMSDASASPPTSYTELEHDHACRRSIPTYVFLADDNPAITRDDGAIAAEPAAIADRQQAYRARLQSSGRLYHTFASDDELLRKIHEIFNERPAVRRKSEVTASRVRRTLLLVGAVLAGIAALLAFAVPGALREACAGEPLRRLCALQGIGGVPTAAQERAFADDARCGCAGLRRYVTRRAPHPALLERAQRAIAASHTEQENHWLRQRRFDYEDHIGFGLAHLAATEAEARSSSVEQLHYRAGRFCSAYLASDRIRRADGVEPAGVDAIRVNCRQLAGRVQCEARGTLYCDVEILHILEKQICRVEGIAIVEPCPESQP